MQAVAFKDADLQGLATRLVATAPGVTPWPIVTEGGEDAGSHSMNMIATVPRPAPLAVTMLERHPHATQSFLALSVSRWLIVLAPDDAGGEPDLSCAFAVLAGPGEAVCIHRNVWHAPLTVLDSPATFAMTMWKRAAGGDGEVRDLASPLNVRV